MLPKRFRLILLKVLHNVPERASPAWMIRTENPGALRAPMADDIAPADATGGYSLTNRNKLSHGQSFPVVSDDRGDHSDKPSDGRVGGRFTRLLPTRNFQVLDTIRQQVVLFPVNEIASVLCHLSQQAIMVCQPTVHIRSCVIESGALQFVNMLVSLLPLLT